MLQLILEAEEAELEDQVQVVLQDGLLPEVLV
jgi:hypothetical protein